MTVRKVNGILWHGHGNYLKVSYTTGECEHLVGNQIDAARLADRAGLKLVPTSDDSVRWVRDPHS